MDKLDSPFWSELLHELVDLVTPSSRKRLSRCSNPFPFVNF